MHKKFEVNWTKIKGSCQLWTKAAHQHSWIDLTLGLFTNFLEKYVPEPVSEQVVTLVG